MTGLVDAVALGEAGVTERFVEPVAGDLVGPAPERDRLPALCPRQLGAALGQGPADAATASPRADDEARQFGLALAGDGARGLLGPKQGDDAPHLDVALGDEEVRCGRGRPIELGAVVGRGPAALAFGEVSLGPERNHCGGIPLRRLPDHDSSIKVTGPSLTRATPMQAPKMPLAAPRRSQKRS